MYGMPVSVKLLCDHIDPQDPVWDILTQFGITLLRQNEVAIKSPLWKLSFLMSESNHESSSPFAQLFLSSKFDDACEMLIVLIIEYVFLPWQTHRTEKRN